MAAYDTRNGWELYRYSAFKEDLAKFTRDVEELEANDPTGYVNHPKAKFLKRVLEIVLTEIPQNPNDKRYRLGGTLGPAHTNWRRAKFLGRFRLFFRFDSKSKKIIYAWLNDENTMRKAGSQSDPYSIFKKRLERGNPPSDWDDLWKSVKDEEEG